MNRRLSVSSGELEPSAPVLSAARPLASPPKVRTLLEEPDGERSDGTALALLGDNICSPSPAKSRPKVENSKVEAGNNSVDSSPNPLSEFETVANARAQAYCDAIKLKSPPSSKSTPVIHLASPVSKAEDLFAQLENNKPADKNHPRSSDEQTVQYSEDSQPAIQKSQDDNNYSNIVNHDYGQNNETSIVDVIWALLLTFGIILGGTFRLVFYSILLPLSFVKHTALFGLCALFELASLWLLFASQCYNTLRLITKKVSATVKILCIKGLIWALQLLPWSRRSTTKPQGDEGLAGHSSDQPKTNGRRQL